MNPPDALLVLSFGGPEGPDEVLPFLENVLRGRNVPEERMLAVAEHYHHFGGVSPINAHNRALVAAVRDDLAGAGIDLPVYWGNRNWHPLLADTVAAMRADGVRRAAVFVTSAFGSWSGCRQYREDLGRAGAAPGDPRLDKLRLYYDHPGFVEAVADGLAATLADAGPAQVWFSAHSIPLSMAATAPYEDQLRTAARLVAERCGLDDWQLVYQSRSGAPGQPWLGPDVTGRLRDSRPGDTVVVCPIGFVSDHMEVVYDLDTEAAAVAAERGVRFLRSPTAGTHPAFVTMVRELLVERLDPAAPRRALGPDGPWPDECPAGCCAGGGRPPAAQRVSMRR
ncbi:MAG TPA: ferrochelatase [Acidimicrobiales bacterium]|nr:ferrochelatase [Acidimicrobiales bacterium]